MSKDNPYELPDWDWEKPDLSGWTKQQWHAQHFTQDWVHVDDYNLVDANWVSFNTIGSSHQVEMDLNTGKYRHRSRNEMGPWRPGQPPRRNE